jgi:MFS family permease
LTGRFRSWFGAYGEVLAQRDVRLLFSGLVISATGSWAYNTALLAFIYDRTHSLGWVGAAGVARMLASLVLSPYSGVIVERSDRFRLLLGTNLLAAVWQVGLAILVISHGPVVVAIALSMLTAAANAFEKPAVGATMPTLVPEGNLVAANALQSTIDNLTVIVGPAVGAVLLIAGSASVVFFVNAASFVLTAILVSQIRHRTVKVDVSEGGTVGFLSQMGVGMRTILGARSARVLVSLCALVSFVYGTDTVLFIAVSAHKLGTGARGYGFLMVGLGIGGVLMAAAVDRLASRPRLAWVIIAGVAGYCLPTALLVVIRSPVPAVVVEVFRGGSTLVVDVLAFTALQRATPSDQLGRVMGIFWALITAVIALGMLITPPITRAFGLDGGLWVMAVAPFLVGLLALPALRAVDRATAAASAALGPRVALLEQLDMFASASRPLLERLASLMQDREFITGTPIVTEGAPADYLYVLIEGQVEVTASGEAGGAPRLIRTMRAPVYFGEIGILERIPRTASVIAASACRCALLDGDTLLEVLNDAAASTSLRNSASSRLALTHPSLRSGDDEAATLAGSL